jgi:RNA polymerase sigma-70 factor (ECF subfamily)
LNGKPVAGLRQINFSKKSVVRDKLSFSRQNETEETMNSECLEELVCKAQTGDRDAFGQLVERFESTIYWIVLRRLRNHAEAAETTQDVFVQAMRKLPQLREPDRFTGWLKQIAVRMSINRAVRRPLETVRSHDTFGVIASNTENPLDDILRTERADQVRGGLDRLRDLDRQTLVAFYFEGRSLKEMSDELESPIGTIKRRLHVARNRLRDELTHKHPVSCAG